MKFVDKKVKVYPNNEDIFVILTEPVIGTDHNFYCLVGFEDIAHPANVKDITFCEKLTNDESNDTTFEKFQPNWDIIKYDWLAMEANGSWYSYENKPTFDEEYATWSCGGSGGANCKVLHIKYVHPVPHLAIYRRP